MKLGNKGIYLIEAILMVAILSSFLLMIPLMQSQSCKLKTHYFVQTLSNDIKYSKIYSITHFTTVKISFYPNDYKYKIIDGTLNILDIRDYDHSLVLSSSVVIHVSHGYTTQFVSFDLTCLNENVILSIYEKSGIIDVQ